MSRSIKKGPYVAPELLKRVEAMNEKNEKKVLKTVAPPSSPLSLATPSLSMTAGSMCPCISRRIWSVTSWVSLLPPVPSVATPRINN